MGRSRLESCGQLFVGRKFYNNYLVLPMIDNEQILLEIKSVPPNYNSLLDNTVCITITGKTRY